jgi:phospholipase C
MGRWAVFEAVAIVLLLASTALVWGAEAAPATTLTKLALFDQHISHVIFLMQENHAFDSLFGTYCPVMGPFCAATANGIPPGTCLPKNLSAPTGPCIAPYNFTAQQLTPKTDLPHDWNSTHLAWNNGAMNGFFPAELGRPQALGHYNGSTVPVYWDIAEQYGLADDFFSSAASYSLPNHWFEVSDAAPNASYLIALHGPNVTASQQDEYLNQSNTTPAIENQLVRSNVSWTSYDFALPSYGTARLHQPAAVAYDYWNPLDSRAQSYQPSVISHFESRSDFFSAASNGTLPNLSWIVPSAQDSDHPPFNITLGQNWVAKVVDAVEKSPEWNSTVLFVSWDEYGGFYDHVAPPTRDADGDGFRVPLLVISPWMRQGFIDSTPMDFGSILHLMEDRFGLKCLGARDCLARLPLEMFNFNRAPRAPIQIFPFNKASYPMSLQSSGTLPRYGPTIGAPIVYSDPKIPQLPSGVDWS